MKIIDTIHDRVQAVVQGAPGHAQYAPETGGKLVSVLLRLSYPVSAEPPYPCMGGKIGGGVQPFAVRNTGRAYLRHVLPSVIGCAERDVHIPFVVEGQGFMGMPVFEKIRVVVGEDHFCLARGDQLSRGQLVA